MERRIEVFETHVTVKDSATDEILNQIAAEVGGKVTNIVLARGQSPVQPMITFSEVEPLAISSTPLNV